MQDQLGAGRIAGADLAIDDVRGPITREKSATGDSQCMAAQIELADTEHLQCIDRGIPRQNRIVSQLTLSVGPAEWILRWYALGESGSKRFAPYDAKS